MLEFSYIAGEYDKEHNGYKWKSLTYCAKYYGYVNYKAHDALEDVRATLHCYFAICRDKRGRRAAERRKAALHE